MSYAPQTSNVRSQNIYMFASNENMFFHHVPMLCFNFTLGINFLFWFLVGRAWQCLIMWMENNNWTKNLGENSEPQQPHLDENGSREDFVKINSFKICVCINWCKPTKLQRMKCPEFLRVASDAPLKMNMSCGLEIKVDLFIGLSPFIAIPPPSHPLFEDLPFLLTPED